MTQPAFASLRREGAVCRALSFFPPVIAVFNRAWRRLSLCGRGPQPRIPHLRLLRDPETARNRPRLDPDAAPRRPGRPAPGPSPPTSRSSAPCSAPAEPTSRPSPATHRTAPSASPTPPRAVPSSGSLIGHDLPTSRRTCSSITGSRVMPQRPSKPWPKPSIAVHELIARVTTHAARM